MKLIAIVVTLVASLSTANAGGDKIVLESFTGGKTDEGARLLAPLLEALANRGFVAGYDNLGRKFEGRVSRPSLAGRGLPADFATQIEAGHRAWIGGKFDEAVTILTRAIGAAHANTGAFAQNQDARELLSKGLIALALAQQRVGDPTAVRQIFAELLRSFPNAAVPRALYGPDAVSAFEQARKELGAAGRGKLAVRSSVEGAVVFINEKIEGGGTITKENLLPGDYRVFVQLANKQLSRSHTVTVKPNETATLTIDVGFDIVVQTSPTWTGLAFSTSAEREKSELGHAAKFGNAIDAEAVAVVGIDQVRGRRVIVGVLVNRQTSTEIRRASVALEPEPSDARLKALAEFLAGDNLQPEGIDVITRGPAASGPVTGGGSVPVERPPTSGRWNGWKFVAGGAALVGFGVGAVLLARDGTCREDPPAGMQCPDVYNTATPAYLSIGGGVALAAVSVYLFVRTGSSSKKTAFLVPTSGGAIAAFAARF